MGTLKVSKPSLPNRVKPAGFYPPADRRLSVFNITGLGEPEVWDIGKIVTSVSGRHLHGRGDILAEAVSQINLTLIADNTPARHVSVVGWPEDESKIQLMATQLAAAAVLKMVSQEIA
jgi:hypothetical protein